MSDFQEGVWSRFHPLTPILRGGVMAVAAVGYVISQQVDRIFGSDQGDPIGGHWGIAAAGLVVVIMFGVFAAWISWQAASFRLSPTNVELRSGVVLKQHRQVRYDRIQAVDITRPLLARICGLSAVKIEAAGGSDSSVTLNFLADGLAQQVREIIIGRAHDSRSPRPAVIASLEESGDVPAPTEPARPIPEALIARIPAARVWAAIALSANAFFLVLALPAVMFAVYTGNLAWLTFLGPMALGAGGAFLGRLTGWMNFEVHGSPDVIRVRHGLTEVRARTVPIRRVQAVEVSQPLLWRPLNWWRIRVNVAGVEQEENTHTDALIPVGSQEEVVRILTVLGPTWPLAEVLAAMTVAEAGPGMVGLPRSARWLDPLSWRRRGYAVTDSALVIRTGRFTRAAVIVPHARIQSSLIHQGPIDRRLDVASVAFHSTVGPVTPTVEHLSTEQALTLLTEQIERSSRARASEFGIPASSLPRPALGALRSEEGGSSDEFVPGR
ncbi:MAG: PH domain-containing protein [Tetrasphaera jenkinsii]|nr:PH domain-containing protein [Tetrasphaera jenkinsii]